MKYTAILFILVSLFACKKQDTRPDCEKNNYCTFTLINGSDSLNMAIVQGGNGPWDTIPPGDSLVLNTYLDGSKYWDISVDPLNTPKNKLSDVTQIQVFNSHTPKFKPCETAATRPFLRQVLKK